MGQPGFGVMIGMLGGNKETVDTFTGAIGKKISTLSLGSDDALHFAFEDGTKIKIFDDGQSCCESRYMRTDDNLQDFVGADFLGGEVKDGPTQTGEYGDEHEIQFLEIKTSKGSFVMSSHNEHNGYYGGFWIVVKPE